MKFIRDGESKKGKKYGYYECKCKNEFYRRKDSAKSGSGLCNNCASKENGLKHKTHGYTGTRLHKIWIQMKARCNIKTSGSYKNYGERGIEVCSEWNDSFQNFRDWAINNGYMDNLTIERESINKNYEPLNCSWKNKNIQQRNTRKIQSNNTSGYRGVSKLNTGWLSQIRAGKENIRIGIFNTKIEAAMSYDLYILTYKLEHTKNFIFNNKNKLMEFADDI